MIVATKAIVFSAIKYSEADLIVTCFTQKEGINAALFGADLNIKSCAIIPLYHASDLGLLCLGSASKERFTQKMGTIFLQQLGELVSARLQGLLVI